MERFSKFKLTKYFTKKEIAGALFVILLFSAALFVSNRYGETLENLVVFGGPIGMAIYLTIAIASVVIAPLAAVPFIPIGVKLWGSLATSILSLSGWTIGAIIAFILAKKYGRPFVEKITSLDRVESITKRIVGRDPFWFVVLARLILPNDVTSYAIGLLVPIKLTPYTIATIIGTAPLAFAVSYGVALPPKLQLVIVAALAVVITTLISAAIIRFRKKKSLPSQKNNTMD